MTITEIKNIATVPDFFTAHYDHPIYECGVQLADMVVLRRSL